jgi:hypothetical protein
VNEHAVWTLRSRPHPVIQDSPEIRARLDEHAHLLGAYDEDVTLDAHLLPGQTFHMLRHGDTYTAVAVDPFGVAVWWTKP